MSLPVEMPSRLAFEGLIREHHRLVLIYARFLCESDDAAGDLTQDAFVIAWRNFSKFDITRDFGAWLRGIVRNLWRTTLRRAGREVAWSDADLELAEADLKAWPPEAGGVFDRLHACLEKLPEPLAAPVRSFYYDGKSTDEAAVDCEINPATLRKRLERARAALRECLGSAG